METTLLTLSKIFTERLFRIPDYQRGYAWTEKQLKDFWSDLEQLEIGKNHYVGVLTLERVDEKSFNKWDDDKWIIKSKKYEPYYIVDGQQRLTTAIILIEAIVESLNENEELNYTSVCDIRRKYIFESKDKGISRSYMFGYEKDNPSYEFLKTKIFCENSEEIYIEQETVYTYNLELAKKFFLDRLLLLTLPEKENLYAKITQHFLFNIYTISDDIDVFVTFETMNNRGKPLSLLELLKNRLIYLTTKFNNDNDDKVRLRKKINECWKTIYHNLGKNKQNPLDDDNFLFYHTLLYFGEEFVMNDEKRNERYIHKLYRSFHWDFSDYLLETKFSSKRIFIPKKSKTSESLTIEEVNKYVDSLQSYVVIWYQLNNPDANSFSKEEVYWLSRINRLGYKDFAPLLLVYLKTINDTSNRVALFKCIEKIRFLLLLISGMYFFRNDEFYITAIDLFYSKATGQVVINKLEKKIQELEALILQDDILIKRFGSNGFYTWDGLKYFMYEYEEFLRSKTKTDRIKLRWEEFIEDYTEHATIEHILPQNSTRKEWGSFYGKFTSGERKKMINSLGNLLPLSKAKNSSLQNKSFLDKCNVCTDKLIGYKYGSYSEIEVVNYGDWNPENLLDRGLKLLNFMEKNWGINLRNDDFKIQMLGLGFLFKKKLINK